MKTLIIGLAGFVGIMLLVFVAAFVVPNLSNRMEEYVPKTPLFANEDAGLDKIARDNGWTVLEKGEWSAREIPGSTDEWHVCKIRIRHTVLGTPCTDVVGCIYGNDATYTMGVEDFEKFLKGDTSVLPKLESLSVN